MVFNYAEAGFLLLPQTGEGRGEGALASVHALAKLAAPHPSPLPGGARELNPISAQVPIQIEEGFHMKLRFSFAAGFVLLLSLPLHLSAQDEPAPAMAMTPTPATAMPRVDQADAMVAPLEYPSVFLDYIPFQPAGLVPWAEVNARVTGTSGHAGHGAMSQRGHAGHAMGGAK